MLVAPLIQPEAITMEVKSVRVMPVSKVGGVIVVTHARTGQRVHIGAKPVLTPAVLTPMLKVNFAPTGLVTVAVLGDEVITIKDVMLIIGTGAVTSPIMVTVLLILPVR